MKKSEEIANLATVCSKKVFRGLITILELIIILFSFIKCQGIQSLYALRRHFLDAGNLDYLYQLKQCLLNSDPFASRWNLLE